MSLSFLIAASSCALVAHLGEAEHRRIGAVGRHVEHADRELGAEPAAQLRERRAVVAVSSFVRLVELATSFGQLGKRAPSASSCFQAVELSSMLASRNAAVEAGKAWAARPSVPAAPAAPALSELPQPASTRPARASAAHAGERCRRTGGVERSCPHFIGERGSRDDGANARAMPNIFEPEFDQQREHPASAPSARASAGSSRRSASAPASGRSSPARRPIRTTTTWPRRSC